jgi:hypothetical protein
VLHHRDITQIAVELMGIEAEAYHEAIRDLETAKVHRDLHDAARVAIQEGQTESNSAPGRQFAAGSAAEAGIDNVLDNATSASMLSSRSSCALRRGSALLEKLEIAGKSILTGTSM